MKTIKVISRVLAVLSAVALQWCVSSCDKNAHNGEDGVYLYPQFVTPDHKTELKDIKVWVFDSEGGKVDEFDFATAGDMVSTPLKLAPGNYSFVALANLRDDFEVFTPDNMSMPTSDDEESGESEFSYAEEIFVCFKNYSVRDRSFSGGKDYSVRGEGVEIISLPMKSFLSEVELSLGGLSVSRNYTLRSYTSSLGFYPARKAADGSYGVPMDVPNGADMGCERILSPSAPSAVFYIFPDTPSEERSYFRFDSYLVDPMGSSEMDGYDLVSVKGYRMYPGHRYQLNFVDAGNGVLYYSVNKSIKVNDWTDRWETPRSMPPQ